LDWSLTVVLINPSPSAATATIHIPSLPTGLKSFQSFTSASGSYWQPGTATASGGQAAVSVPGYGVVTLAGFGGGYNRWRGQNFTHAEMRAGLAKPQTVAAGDGIENLFKYAFNIAQPWKATPLTTAGLPHVTRKSSGRLMVSFRRARTELTYTVEVSNDRRTWMALATNPGSVSLATDVQVVDRPTVNPPPPGATGRYLRTRVRTPDGINLVY
jgi:hypothetical protein